MKAQPAKDDSSWLPRQSAAAIAHEYSNPDLLGQIENHLRRYVILPGAAYLPAALWAVATHAPEQFDCFPYLALLSPVKRSGKTRLAEVLETVVRRPWRGTAPSPAALYRKLEQGPTLMLDEVELFNGKNKSETTQILLAVLNVGSRKGGTIPRCIGPRQEVHDFNVYGPKLFAAIGRLPDTLMDRSIVIHMKRRLKAQPVERFRQVLALSQAAPVRDGIERFVKASRADIGHSYQKVLDADLEYLNDRDADLWTPLFAMCAALDAGRLAELKMSAITLSAAKAGDDVDDSWALTLLRDIRAVWPDREDKLETAILLERLKALEESPWGESEHPLTPRKLARMLKPFEVEPRTLRFENRTAKGYLYAPLKTLFDQYLDDLSVTCDTSQ
jgi:hypothetical protein